MKTPLRIVVTGLAATYPYGGVFWDYMQYPLGLRRLGHDVLYVEDSGQWCYDPVNRTFVADGKRNAAWLGRVLAVLNSDLHDRWYFRDANGRSYGRPWSDVVDYCRTADLFLHLSFSCTMRDEYLMAGRIALIDSDPVFTQASIPEFLAGTGDDATRQRVEELRRHDVFFTLGENFGASDCRIPTGLVEWRPTRQPIVREVFESEIVPVSQRRHTLTTVASWKSTERTAIVNGTAVGGKNLEFMRFIDLPARSAIPLELALNGLAPLGRLRKHGWTVVDPDRVSGDPWSYRQYLAHSFGEWSVAKNAYVASRSGWFSCRSACYLAMGVPTVVQDTGFGHVIPTGTGVLPFATLEEAAGAIESLLSDPMLHANAARAIAREYFDSDRVLSKLIDDAFRDGARYKRTTPATARSGMMTPAAPPGQKSE